MANNFKKIIDRMMWVPTSVAPNTHTAGASLCSDLRSDVSRTPYVYFFSSSSLFHRYNTVTKGWDTTTSAGVGGTTNIGSASVFLPTGRTTGDIGSSAFGTSTTTLYLANTSGINYLYGANTLANRGGSGEYGFKIRVIGKTAGKTEERFIVANTGNGMPMTVELNAPLSFTPTTGDTYELLSGRVLLINPGSTSSTYLREYDVAANSFVTLGPSLPVGLATETSLVAFDEQYTPYDCHPGEGMIKGGYLYDSGQVDRYALVATGTASASLTGQATGGDYDVVANEYRSFQLRIVEDTTNPGAVGQRNFISSHTAGPSPVYTLGTSWSVQPSSTAKYVIEMPNLLFMRTASSTTFYTLNYGRQTFLNGSMSISANAWTTAFSAAGSALAQGGFMVPCWGMRPDTARNARHGHILMFRGGGLPTLDLFDLSAAGTGSWTSNVTYDGMGITLSTGSCGTYDSVSNEGRFFYLNRYITSGTNNTMFRFDVRNRTMAPIIAPDILQTAGASVGCRMAAVAAIDGDDVYSSVTMIHMASTVTHEFLVLA